MAGDGVGRLAQVRTWVAERAAGLGVPMSTGLLCETAVAALDVTGAVLLMARSSGFPEIRNSTGALGARLAELQVTVGEGPSLDAQRLGGPVLVGYLDTVSSQYRWPVFTPLAVQAGAAAMFALPMCVGAISVGVLALHRDRPGPLPPTMLLDSLAFAELALALLLDEQAGVPTDADGAATGGGLSLHSPQVHQATGMVAGQLDVSMDEAFVRLRARAFADRRELAELSADVVARRLRFHRDGDVS